MQTYNYNGWLPDRPDHRDFLVEPPGMVALPEAADLREFCSAVENQGALGSCTANAIVGALEYLERVKWKGKYLDLSRLFVYWNERDLIGTTGEDSGAFIRDGIKTLKSQGVCLESIWKYDIRRFTARPSKQAYIEAANHRIVRYARLPRDLNALEKCLADGRPFTFGFTVYTNFQSQKTAKTGWVDVPGSQDVALGGHAVLAVGYLRSKRVFICRNSWGDDWGDGGYFYLPYEFLMNPGLSDDFWVIQSANV